MRHPVATACVYAAIFGVVWFLFDLAFGRSVGYSLNIAVSVAIAAGFGHSTGSRGERAASRTNRWRSR